MMGKKERQQVGYVKTSPKERTLPELPPERWRVDTIPFEENLAVTNIYPGWEPFAALTIEGAPHIIIRQLVD